MSSKVKKKEIQPYWRPDFRNAASLPDIKVVRTDFIVNSIAILIAFAVCAFILQREYRAWSIGSAVEELEKRIRIAEPDDNILLKRSEQFRKAGGYIQDLDTFYDSPFRAHELLVALSKLKDDDLILSSLRFSEAIIQQNKKAKVEYLIDLNGEVRDLPTLDDYVVSLRSLELFELEGYEADISEDPRPRNASTGLYPYAVNIKLSPADPKKKGKGAKK